MKHILHNKVLSVRKIDVPNNMAPNYKRKTTVNLRRNRLNSSKGAQLSSLHLEQIHYVNHHDDDTGGGVCATNYPAHRVPPMGVCRH
jgi:hypothetical protein